jgi:hypothetical protein
MAEILAIQSFGAIVLYDVHLRHVLTNGQTRTRKAVMRALTHRVTVEDRKQFYATFRLSVVDAGRSVNGPAGSSRNPSVWEDNELMTR